MRILSIIPARGGSKGIPNKNIKLLCGKPLLQFTSEVAQKSKYISKLILSSDDDAIIKVGQSLGLKVPFKRPSSLAGDKSPTIDVVKHALQFFEEKGEKYDAVCLLQVTSPFRSVKFLDKAIETFMASKTDALISVIEVPHEFNPHWTFMPNVYGNLEIATGDKNIITRRQDLPKSYHRDGSIYLTKTSTILKDNSLYGNSISYVVSDEKFHVNIDTLEDWEKAEIICKSLI